MERVWLNNKKWAKNRIRSSARWHIAGSGFAATLCLGMGVFFFLEIWPGVVSGRESKAILLMLIFPLAGVFDLVDFCRKVLEWMRFGPVELQLNPFPGSLGQHVGGTFRLRGQAARKDDYQNVEVKLNCVRSYYRRSGGENDRREDIVWGTKGPATVRVDHLDARDLLLDFRFDVPGDLPGSEEHLEQSDYHLWRLYVEAELPGADLKRHYEIPVFDTDEASTLTVDSSIGALEQQEESLQRLNKDLDEGKFQGSLVSENIRFTQEGYLLKLYHPMGRGKMLGAVAMLFCLVPGFIGASFLNMGGDSVAMTLFAALGLIPAFIAVLAFFAWMYCWFNSLSVVIDDKQVSSTRRMFLIPVKKSHCLLSDIDRFSIKRTGSTNAGADKIEHFKVMACAKGDEITVAESINGEEVAEAFCHYLAERYLPQAS